MENFDSIKILWRHPYNGYLYGIPYELRPGQTPNDLFKAKWPGKPMSPGDRESVWSGGKDSDTVPNDWILVREYEAGSEWWKDKKQRDLVPGQPYEWQRLTESTTKQLVEQYLYGLVS